MLTVRLADVRAQAAKLSDLEQDLTAMLTSARTPKLPEEPGDGSENGTWRNFYLMGALELRHGYVRTPTSTTSPDILGALTLDRLLDSMAIRVDGPASWDADITVRWSLTSGQAITMWLRNGVLTHVAGRGPASVSPDVEITLDEHVLRAVLLGTLPPADLPSQDGVQVDGDLGKLLELLGHLDAPDPEFAMVTP